MYKPKTVSRDLNRLGEQPVTINRNTTIQSFTPEEELNYLVNRGDWELVISSPAFEERTPEAQAQVLTTAIDNRIKQLEKSLNHLVNRGQNYHAASIGVLQRLHQLNNIRDEVLKRIYENYPRVVGDRSK